MGPKGSGKSSFICNLLANDTQRKPTISHQLEPCTQNIEHFCMTVSDELLREHVILQGLVGRRIVLLDTPGFDDGSVGDFEILRRVAHWVAASYSQDVQVAAFLYIYPIYPGRFTRSEGKNLQMFSKLCGPSLMPRVMLATSNWHRQSRLEPGQDLPARENELKTKFWEKILKAGASIDRLDNCRAGELSAHALLVKMLERMADTERDCDGSILSLQFQLLEKRRKSFGRLGNRRLKERIDALLKERNYMGDTDSLKTKALNLIREELHGDGRPSWTERLKPIFQ
ncbi:hypothetical protein FA15DRAFT_388311 [Coprinopsis marcescibilis]|uniref:G domain-containing protein n=1 Tax=Coprinopsis marcescibilis TaxID=230819 RepID=A0A5C3KXL6_COPMA|nr:hypothetical protein FA15DRAFT_388311 [Coprinopsis marcescibilis]